MKIPNFFALRNHYKRLRIIQAFSGVSLRKDYLRMYLKRYIFSAKKRSTWHTEKIAGYIWHFESYDDFFANFFEIFINLEYYNPAMQSPDYILDLGGYIGLSTLFFTILYKAPKIDVYEPNKETFAYLAKNIEANGLSNVTPHNIGFGEKAEEVTFYTNPNSKTCMGDSIYNTFIPHHDRIDTITTLDAGTYDYSPYSLLKIDIEGCESFVFNALRKNMFSINAIVFEYHHFFDKARNSLTEILSILEEKGFHYYYLPCHDSLTVNREDNWALMIHAWRTP